MKHNSTELHHSEIAEPASSAEREDETFVFQKRVPRQKQKEKERLDTTLGTPKVYKPSARQQIVAWWCLRFRPVKGVKAAQSLEEPKWRDHWATTKYL